MKVVVWLEQHYHFSPPRKIAFLAVARVTFVQIKINIEEGVRQIRHEEGREFQGKYPCMCMCM